MTPQRVVGLFNLFQDAAAIIRVALAGLGQPKAARGAQQQQHAQPPPSAATLRVTEGADIRSRRAAAAKLCASATARNTVIS